MYQLFIDTHGEIIILALYKNGDVLEIGDCKRARRIIEGTQEGRNSIHLLKQKELL